MSDTEILGILTLPCLHLGIHKLLPFWWLSGKESACNAGVTGWIPRLGRSPGKGNGNPLQYPCVKNLMDRGAWQATIHRVTKESDTT